MIPSTMTTHTRTYEVKDYAEHGRLFGRLSKILTDSLYKQELKIERVEIDFKDGENVFKYDKENTPDLCELLMKQKCKGEKIKISLITRNGTDKEKYKEIFDRLEEEAFTAYYPHLELPQKN